MRKKLKDMTPYERVEQRMKGLSNEEAEDVAVKILAQVLAKHVHIFGDGEKYLESLMKKIVDATREYSMTHSMLIAMGKVVHEREEEIKKMLNKS